MHEKTSVGANFFKKVSQCRKWTHSLPFCIAELLWLVPKPNNCRQLIRSEHKKTLKLRQAIRNEHYVTRELSAVVEAPSQFSAQVVSLLFILLHKRPSPTCSAQSCTTVIANTKVLPNKCVDVIQWTISVAECTSVNFSWTNWFSTTCCDLIPWFDTSVAVNWTCIFAANFSEIHEWLPADSHKASTLSVLDGDCNLASRIYSKPLTSVWETLLEFSHDSFFSGKFVVSVTLFSLHSVLGGKSLSAPCNKTLSKLKQPSAVHLCGFGLCRKECCPFRHGKQSFLSATNFPLRDDVFPPNTR